MICTSVSKPGGRSQSGGAPCRETTAARCGSLRVSSATPSASVSGVSWSGISMERVNLVLCEICGCRYAPPSDATEPESHPNRDHGGEQIRDWQLQPGDRDPRTTKPSLGSSGEEADHHKN